MAPLPPSPGTARIRFSGFNTTSGSTGGCRVFVTNGEDGGYSDSDVATIAVAMLAPSTGVLVNSLVTMQSTAWRWSTCIVEDLTSDTAPSFEQSGAINGTYTEPALPPQCAVALSWQISRRYRGGKPRTYIPAIPTAAVGGDGSAALTSAYMTIAEDAGATFLANINGIAGLTHDIQLCNVSYFSGLAPRISPQVDVTQSVVVHGRLDSQRRRSGKESAFPVG